MMKKYLVLIITMVVLQHICNAQFPPNYPAAPPAPANITSIEYFINSKPEFGSGTAVAGFTSSPNIVNYTTNVAIGVAPGMHRYYIRCKGADGKWSLSNNVFFDNYNVPLYETPVAPGNVTAIEYFFNNKPEFGSGAAVTGFTASPNISNYNTNIAITVPPGIHRLYLRSKDVGGKWSHTNDVLFTNYDIPQYGSAAAVVNMVQAEYFFDDQDLGFGNCTQIPINPSTNIIGLNVNVNITGLPQGVHRLNIRCKDANGKWSITNSKVFDNSAVPPYPAPAVPPPAIANMEYFIDTDPGFNNAAPITVPGNTGAVNNYAANLNLSGSLTTGTHRLYIRSKQNPWSLTNVAEFTVSPPSAWVWNGSVSDVWSDPANWDNASVPGVTSNVIIPSGLSRYPVVYTNTEIRKLDLLNGSTVTVFANVTLIVNGQ
jgi:hypothetical protein